MYCMNAYLSYKCMFHHTTYMYTYTCADPSDMPSGDLRNTTDPTADSTIQVWLSGFAFCIPTDNVYKQLQLIKTVSPSNASMLTSSLVRAAYVMVFFCSFNAALAHLWLIRSSSSTFPSLALGQPLVHLWITPSSPLAHSKICWTSFWTAYC